MSNLEWAPQPLPPNILRSPSLPTPPPPLLKELFCLHSFDFFLLFPRLTKIQRGQVWIQSYTFYLQILKDQRQTKEGRRSFPRKSFSQVCQIYFNQILVF